MWNEKFTIRRSISDIKFIHIGKCGGTSIVHYLAKKGISISSYHMKRPPLNENIKYVMWVRDPIDRFVSAFNHLRDIVNFPTYSIKNIKELRLDNCPAPQKIINKINNGFAFSKELDECIKKFNSAEMLISSLESNDKSLRLSAEKIMNSNYEHIKKGIAWYLYNGNFIKKNEHKFLMVGQIENFSSDFNNFLSHLNLDHYSIEPHLRKTKMRKDNGISKNSKEYLIKNYLNNDYLCLKLLKEKSLIQNY